MKYTALLLTFYMLIGSLIPRTDFSQLVHLGDLKAHYLTHKAEAIANNQTLSFLEFCYIHFVDTSQHSEDNHESEHNQLPFQSLNTVVQLDILSPTELSLSHSFVVYTNDQAYTNPFYLTGFGATFPIPPSC